MTLDKLPLGQEAVITAVGGEGALRCRLLDMGLIPRTGVRVEKISSLGRSPGAAGAGILSVSAERGCPEY